MNQTLSQYKKMAYLSYQLIVHFKHLQVNDQTIVLFMDVKHTSDFQYQPIVLTIPRQMEFQRASRPAFMHIFENFQKYNNFAQPSMNIKARKTVTFDEIVKVREFVQVDNYDYCKYLIE